jgi:hypothetical protein
MEICRASDPFAGLVSAFQRVVVNVMVQEPAPKDAKNEMQRRLSLMSLGCGVPHYICKSSPLIGSSAPPA